MKTTKQLARELGFIRKKAASNKSDKILSPKQSFSFLVVLDFESTCWQDGKFRTQEIIEFPAVLLNTATGQIESEFQFYVQPQEQPILSDFCKQLTGITQEQVDNGIPLHLCIRKFVRWLESLKESKGVVFKQTTEKCNLATIVTWSDWDLGVCLYNEIRRKQIMRPAQLNSWIDLRATYRKFYSRKPNGLNGALKDVGIEFEGREHSGLHDSRNTARLAYKMIKDGCIMNITKSLNVTSLSREKYLPLKNVKQLTPSKSPLHKRRKQSEDSPPENEEEHFDDDLDHAIANSQEINNILSQVAMETPERKRKSRIPVLSPKSNKKTTGSLVQSKLTKKKVTRIIPGKFNPSDIYVDTVDTSDAYVTGEKYHNKLSNISVNVPLPSKQQKNKTPSDIYVDTVDTSDAYVTGEKYHNKLSNISVNIPLPSKLQKNKTPSKKGANIGSRSPRSSVTPKKFNSGLNDKNDARKKTSCQRNDHTCNGNTIPGLSVTSNVNTGKTPISVQSKSQTSVQIKLVASTPCNKQSTQIFKTPGISSVTHDKRSKTFTTPSVILTNTSNRCSTVSSGTFHTPSIKPPGTFKTPSTTSVNTTGICRTPSATPLTTPGTFRTPLTRPMSTPSHNPSGMKGTPPLCNCGKRSKRRMTQTPGPNLGRFFFTCGSSNYNSTKKNGCSFFKWETPAGIRTQSFTQDGTLSKPFIPVFNNSSTNNTSCKKNLGVRSNSISSFR